MSEIIENNEVLAQAPVSEVEQPKKKSPKVELSDFDWDNYGKKESSFSKEEREKLENAYGNTFKTLQEGEIINAVVVAKTEKEVIVDIGYKSEGVINRSEFKSDEIPANGDSVEVYVDKIEGLDGQLVLSHKKANLAKAWDRVNEICRTQEIIKGYIKCRTKGGMIVDVLGLEAFLPGSQMEARPVKDYDAYVGKTMEFIVIKINDEFKNIVVSHKAIIDAQLEEQKKEIISKLEKGQVLEGVVKAFQPYGAFVDLGGVDGLIHIIDLSWGRVTHPEEIVQLDSKINVVVLGFDEEKQQIALGLKQLTPHPWDALDPNLKVGDIVTGKVVVVQDYGAFVEIASGVEGLVHVSEMSWSQHLHQTEDFLKVGDEVTAKILTLEREERKMSLGIKQLTPDPWENIDEKYPVNSRHIAKTRNFTNFGVFVEIEEGIDGLIHISDLSWTKKIKHPNEFTSLGADIEVVVLEIDKENRRLALGHKQIEKNPWDDYENIFVVDTIHEGLVKEMSDKGFIISFNGVEGFTTPAHLKKENGTQAKIGEVLDFKVIEFNKDIRRIFVSHSRIHEDLNKVIEEVNSEVAKAGKKKIKNDKIETTTIGDLTGLAELHEEMIQQEKEAKNK